MVVRRLAVETIAANFCLPEAVRGYEARFIKRALKEADGSVTRAAERLGISYQRLASLLDARHKDLASARSPVMRRRRSIIKQPKK